MHSQIRRAVIVEDNTVMRKLIHAALASLGVAEIAEARDGAEAIETIRAGGADVVIMDWVMDVMDGLECTRLIRAGVAGIDPGVPIILLTGMPSEDARAKGLAAGVDLVLAKPTALGRLDAALRDVLGRRAVGRAP